jgi:hypothetical protein
MGNTIDLWLRGVWMICNCGRLMTGLDSRFLFSRTDLVQRDRLRTPRSRCGAKGVLRHTSLSVLASVRRRAGRQKPLCEGQSKPDHRSPRTSRCCPTSIAMSNLQNRPAAPLRLPSSVFSLHITAPASLDSPPGLHIKRPSSFLVTLESLH